MYRLIHGNTNQASEAANFIELLNTLDQQSIPEARELFDTKKELLVTRAPGRLDVMGGIADYSGSLVLELPIREATFAALQRDLDLKLRVVSLPGDANQKPAFEMALSDFVSAGKIVDYNVARSYFESDPNRHWAAYVAGVFLVLMRERNISFSQGARILVSSTVPPGKGVSSSAALEVAVMQAVVAAFDLDIEPREVALLCQKVENLVVGAPSGIMDQMTSVCGQADRLLALICQPAEIREMIAIPADIVFWGVDSGIRHSVAGADYASVRAAAFMGYRIIADLAGLSSSEVTSGEHSEIDDPRWGGYLANVPATEFEKNYVNRLPERISGAEFLEHYKGTTDPVTRIKPEREYAVRVCTAHPIYEHERVRRFAEMLCRGVRPWAPIDANAPGATPQARFESTARGAHGGTLLQELGELMYQSHDSYSACGLNSEGTDLLVKLVREAGPGEGLYGAKITGGGSGGTVAVLGDSTSGPSVARLAEEYARQTGHQSYIFAGSSSGSATFGHLKLQSV